MKKVQIGLFLILSAVTSQAFSEEVCIAKINCAVPSALGVCAAYQYKVSCSQQPEFSTEERGGFFKKHRALNDLNEAMKNLGLKATSTIEPHTMVSANNRYLGVFDPVQIFTKNNVSSKNYCLLVKGNSRTIGIDKPQSISDALLTCANGYSEPFLGVTQEEVQKHLLTSGFELSFNVSDEISVYSKK